MTDTTDTTDIRTAATDTTPADLARHETEHQLRRVLRANAVNSIVFGVLLASIPARLDDLLDTGHPGWVRVVGLGLIPFGAFCAWLSTASTTALRRITPQVVLGDVGWVAASIVTVCLGWYSAGGVAVVLALAAIVEVFALLQWNAWRRLRVTR